MLLDRVIDRVSLPSTEPNFKFTDSIVRSGHRKIEYGYEAARLLLWMHYHDYIPLP